MRGDDAESEGTWTLSWTGVGGATSYNLMEAGNGGTLTTVQNDGNTSWSTSRRGNGTYTYQVQGCNAGGCGPFSAQVAVTVALIPAMPTGLAVQVLSPPYKGRYTVSWSGVDGATRYEVKYQAPTEADTPYSGADTTFTGILINTSGNVDFQVRACNDTGCSDWSPAASAQFDSE